MTASRRTFRPITADVAACADWAVRTLAAAAVAEVGLTDEAVLLDQLPELTVEMFTWPGLLERADQVLTDAGLAVLAMFLTERRAHPWPLAATEQMMLAAGIGPAAADLLDDTRIAAGPYQVVQHAYRIIALVSELLHHRHGPHSRPLQRLGDVATTTLLELQDHLADTTTPAAHASSRVRTLRPLPIHLPPPRLGA